MDKKNYLRGAAISFLIICSIIATKNFNIALIISLVGSFFMVRSFGVLEYLSCAAILLAKTQSDVILSSNDLLSNVENYNAISTGASIFGVFEHGEIILPAIFWFISRFFEYANIEVMSFLFVLFFLILFYPIVYYLRHKPLVALYTVLLVDVNFIVHLFRQTFASLILLIVMIQMIKKTRFSRLNGLCLFIFSGFIHLTSYVFFPIMLLIKKTPLRLLKIIVISSALLGIVFLIKNNFFNMLVMLYGIPIVGKASYSTTVFESASGVRVIAIIATIIALFIRDESCLFKLFLGFVALSLFFYQIPIVGCRIGLIGTSILTGLPIGLFVYKLRHKISNSIVECKNVSYGKYHEK